MPTPPKVDPGKRAIVAGRTGSGKSSFACWLLMRSPGHWIILNPKWTLAFKDLPGAVTIEGLDMKKIVKSIEENRFTIVNPMPAQTNPVTLDLFIQWYHETYTSLGMCVDESYAIHQNGRAGAGLIGLLTRGRELKQSFIGLTQRPAYLSKFLFSEADYIVGMSLTMEDDRKRMFEFTGKRAFEEKLPAREWLWYDVAEDELTKWGAVPLPAKRKDP